MKDNTTSQKLAVAITRAASTQTYFTIRFLVDREHVPDAYRAYAYFRWVDDCLDSVAGSTTERLEFVARQKSLLEACYSGEIVSSLSPQEMMLADLVHHDHEKNSGLQSYLRNMMAVMVFDVERRGRMISQAELTTYTQLLATAVTDALLYFIGHASPAPASELRYLAVRGAHLVHMLRDMQEDASVGYFNIPQETLAAYDIAILDVNHPAYQKWVHDRVELATLYFHLGRDYLSQIRNTRCRLAGFAYIARFEWMARTVKRDGYCLRADYPERKTIKTALWVAWKTLSSLLGLYRPIFLPREHAIRLFE